LTIHIEESPLPSRIETAGAIATGLNVSGFAGQIAQGIKFLIGFFHSISEQREQMNSLCEYKRDAFPVFR
jgi:hypothetical protein